MRYVVCIAPVPEKPLEPGWDVLDSYKEFEPVNKVPYSSKEEAEEMVEMLLYAYGDLV